MDLKTFSRMLYTQQITKKKIKKELSIAKNSVAPGPLHTGSKAHAEEEETPEDEQRESKLPRDIVEDNLVLGQL